MAGEASSTRGRRLPARPGGGDGASAPTSAAGAVAVVVPGLGVEHVRLRRRRARLRRHATRHALAVEVRRAVGVDLAAGAVHVVVVEAGRVVDGAVVSDPAEVVSLCVGADRIGIDAPAAPSPGVHAGDAAALPKLRTGRCGELAAAEQLGVWVAFVTGAAGACPAWMETGFAVWAALRADGHEPIEVYPAGSVWLEQRRWPPRKTTPAGLAARRALLARHLELPRFVELWSHDSIDATIAAAVAAQGQRAVRAGHDDPGCDGSAIWFLSPPAARPGDA